jgi:hypothetical protein
MPASPIKAGAAVLAAAFLLQIAFAASYVGALHRPQPHAVPIAVVGPGAAQSAQQLNGLTGRPLDARVATSRAAAVEQVEQRGVYGIVEPATNRLDVASAANRAAAGALETTLDRVQAAQGKRALQVHDLKPLPAADPNGVAAFYTVIAWVFGGYRG